MKITLDLPDTVASGGADRRYFQKALVAMLYQTGDLSSKEACDVLGLERREFEEMLPRFGVAIMPDDDENIQAELSA